MNTKRIKQLLARNDELSPLKFKSKPEKARAAAQYAEKSKQFFKVVATPQSSDGAMISQLVNHIDKKSCY